MYIASSDRPQTPSNNVWPRPLQPFPKMLRSIPWLFFLFQLFTHKPLFPFTNSRLHAVIETLSLLNCLLSLPTACLLASGTHLRRRRLHHQMRTEWNQKQKQRETLCCDTLALKAHIHDSLTSSVPPPTLLLLPPSWLLARLPSKHLVHWRCWHWLLHAIYLLCSPG